MNLRYLLSFLRVMKTPGFFPILKDWQGFVRMQFIHAALESGLLEALSVPCSREDLIKALEVQRLDLFDALLEVGLASKELVMENGLFSIRGTRSKAVSSPNGDALAAMIQANVSYYSDAYRQAAQRMRGGALGDDLERIGDLVARFSKISEPIIRDFIAGIVRGKRPMRIFDIGCGSGALIKCAADANPLATGIGLDVDAAVVRQAQGNLSAWGLADRFRIVLGDVRQLAPESAGPYDLITLYNLLYYFPASERPALLQSLRAMLAPRGTIAVAMGFHSRGEDLGMANLNLINSSLQGVNPLPELDAVTALLRQAGLREIEVHRFMPGSRFFGIVARL